MFLRGFLQFFKNSPNPKCNVIATRLLAIGQLKAYENKLHSMYVSIRGILSKPHFLAIKLILVGSYVV